MGNSNKPQRPLLGGPGSMLPFWLESLLSWMLAISCLSVALYHYAVQILISPTSKSSCLSLPLTTHSRREIQLKSALERYQQLSSFLEQTKPVSDWTDDDLVSLIRSNRLIRRLVSVLMVKYQKEEQSTVSDSLDLIQILTRIWPRLVELPSFADEEYDFEISVIIPAYREDGRELVAKLQQAHALVDSTFSRRQIEIILVHSENCTNLELLDDFKFEFSKVTRIQDQGGGRGPCLNQGAHIARGRILTFLHADTRLPPNWNLAISNDAFPASSSQNKNNMMIANACAFGFAIDTAHLEMRNKQSSSSPDLYYPPGIRAVEQTANWRSHWFHLPYGDQCLSIPHYVFRYIGGFPHQCLMEDYEVVRLLRQRVAHSCGKEELKILNPTAKCSVRRWQKFGVLYVTYFNSKLVNLYAKESVTADELFQLYYGNPPAGADKPLPWETELERLLSLKE